MFGFFWVVLVPILASTILVVSILAPPLDTEGSFLYEGSFRGQFGISCLDAQPPEGSKGVQRPGALRGASLGAVTPSPCWLRLGETCLSGKFESKGADLFSQRQSQDSGGFELEISHCESSWRHLQLAFR